MIRSGAVTLVRRRLNERAADDLSDDEIKGLINEALVLVQKEIIKVDPFAFFAIAYVDTVAGTAGEFYEVPADLWYELEVGYKPTASSSYSRLTRDNYETIRETSDTASAKYARRGRYFAIWPNPTAAVTAGLRLQYVPTLAIDISSSHDADVLPVHPALHMAVVAWATMLAIAETLEDRTPLGTELATYLGDIPSWYHRGGDPAQIRLSLNRDP